MTLSSYFNHWASRSWALLRFWVPVGALAGAASNEDLSPLLTHIRRRHNDLNIMMVALNNLPKLQRIRALCQSMLNALNKTDRPSGENGRYDRWNWLTACLRFWIRLEDCTGQSLGRLPQDNDYEDESTDESGDERSDDDYDTMMMTGRTSG